MALEAYIDGVPVTTWQGVTSTHWLNKKYIATIKIPVAQAGAGAIGSRLKLVDTALADPLDHHGTIKVESADDGEDGDGMVEYTSESARELWEWRPARDGPSDGDDPGNYVTPDFLSRLEFGGPIMQDVLLQSQDGSDPAQGEGDMAIAMGSFPATGPTLSGAPVSWPMSIETLASMLASTGQLDVVETMIDTGTDMSQIDTYPGNYGTNLVGTVDFGYEPDGNVRRLRRTRSMEKMVNKLRYLLGPRLDDEHWRRSIEATNMDIPDTPFYTQAALVAFIMQSRLDYLVRMEIRTYDSFSNESNATPLYWRLWQDESLWRAQPRTLVKVTPIEGLYYPCDIGDLVGVAAHSGFMGGFSGAQRIFGRTLTWDVDGVVSLGELQTSDDAEAL